MTNDSSCLYLFTILKCIRVMIWKTSNTNRKLNMIYSLWLWDHYSFVVLAEIVTESEMSPPSVQLETLQFSSATSAEISGIKIS